MPRPLRVGATRCRAVWRYPDPEWSGLLADLGERVIPLPLAWVCLDVRAFLVELPVVPEDAIGEAGLPQAALVARPIVRSNAVAVGDC